MFLVLDESLHIIVDELNHESTLPLIVLELADLLVSPIRGNSILDKVITNYSDFSHRIYSRIYELVTALCLYQDLIYAISLLSILSSK